MVGSKWLVAEDDVEEVGLFVVLHAVNIINGLIF